ncbi:MAG: paraquat-inducible protein A [Pseudomonadota bacterium]
MIALLAISLTAHLPMPSRLIACHECDLLQQEICLPPGKAARCRRCGAFLYRSPHDCLNRSLAFALAAAVAFLFANIYPLMTLETRGASRTATLLDTVLGLYDQGRPLVASLMLVTAIIVPALNILTMIYLLFPLRFGIVPPGFQQIFRLHHAIRPWGMTEVFMLSALVSWARLTSSADATINLGLWAFGACMLLLAAATASFEPRDLWEKVATLKRRQTNRLIPTNAEETSH